MKRSTHGSMISLEELTASLQQVAELNASAPMPIVVAAPRRLTDFGFMFPELQTDEHLLPPGPATIENLKLLGDTMRDTNPSDDLNADVPAAYTYLGQFIDHDITLEAISDQFGALDSAAVLPRMQLVELLKNVRTATLDLDSVYDSPAPIDGDMMRVGPLSFRTTAGDNVPGQPVLGVQVQEGVNDKFDLPRTPRNPALPPDFDRAALLGDKRNDENLVIAQLHVAFLRAHNEIVNRGHNFESARKILSQLYQWVVIHDFLKQRIVEPQVVERILNEGNRFYQPSDAEFFMPLEFTVAAFRFGHSMIRARYDHNINFPAATLGELFAFTALSGDLHPPGLPSFQADTLPFNWVIEWVKFLDNGRNPIRRIDTRLVEPLFELRNVMGAPMPGIMGSLAVRNLLRGYKLRMPTGQAVANRMGETVLSKAQILAVAANDEQRTVLENTGFATRTPLWFYILAEADHHHQGQRLGPVGGTIVAEVLIGLVQRSANSILELGPDWTPAKLSTELETPLSSEFQLSDLLKLGGVM